MAKCFHMYSMSKTIFFALHCIKNKWEKKHGENFVFFGSNVIPRNVDIDMQNIACEHKIRIWVDKPTSWYVKPYVYNVSAHLNLISDFVHLILFVNETI